MGANEIKALKEKIRSIPKIYWTDLAISVAGQNIPVPAIREWAKDDNVSLRIAAIYACKYIPDADRDNIPWDVLELALYDKEDLVRSTALNIYYSLPAIPLRVLLKLFGSSDPRIRCTALSICVNCATIPLELLELGAKDSNTHVSREAIDTAEIIADGKAFPSSEIPIEKWSKDPCTAVRQMAVCACKSIDPLPVEILDRALHDQDKEVRWDAYSAAHHRPDDIPLEYLEKWSRDQDSTIREVLMYVCRQLKTPCWDILDRGMNDPDDNVRHAAWFVYLMEQSQQSRAIPRSRKYARFLPWPIPLELLVKWTESPYADVRRAAMVACIDRTDIPWDVLDRGISDPDKAVAKLARLICTRRKDTKLSIIQKWAESKDPSIRALSMKVCADRTDIPWEVIEKGLQDKKREVREAAKALCLG